MPNFVITPGGQMVDLETLNQGELTQLYHQLHVMQEVSRNADPTIVDALRHRSDGYRQSAGQIESAAQDMREAYDQGWWDAAKARGVSVMEMFKGQADTAAAAAQYIDPVDGSAIKHAWKVGTGLGGSWGEQLAGNDGKSAWKAAETIIPEIVPKELKAATKASMNLHEAGYYAVEGDPEKAATEATKAIGNLAKDTLIGPAVEIYEGQKLTQQGMQHFEETGQTMDEINSAAEQALSRNKEFASNAWEKADQTKQMANYLEHGQDPAWDDVLQKIRDHAPDILVDQDAVQREAENRRTEIIDQARRAGLPSDVLDNFKSGVDSEKAGPPDSTELVRGPEQGVPAPEIKRPEITGPEFDELAHRDQQALNRIADEKFHAEHPELEGKALDRDAPQELKDEWRQHREDALHQSWENTAVDKAYKEHYEQLGIAPPDKLDPNNPEHAEFVETWNKLQEETTGTGAEIRAQLDQLIADTHQKLHHSEEIASAKLDETRRHVDEAEQSGRQADEALTQAGAAETAASDRLQAIDGVVTAAEGHAKAAGESAAQARVHGDAVGQADTQVKQVVQQIDAAVTAAQGHVDRTAALETQASSHAEKASGYAGDAHKHGEQAAGFVEAAQAHATAAGAAETETGKHAEAAGTNETAAADHAGRAGESAVTAQTHASQAQAAEAAAQTHATAAKDHATKAQELVEQAGAAETAAGTSEQNAERDAGVAAGHAHDSEQDETAAGEAATQAGSHATEAETHATSAGEAEHEAGEHATRAAAEEEAARGHAVVAAEQENLSHQHSENAAGSETEAAGHVEQAALHVNTAQGHERAANSHATAAAGHAEHASQFTATAAGHADQAAQAAQLTAGFVSAAEESAGAAERHAMEADAAEQHAAQSAATALGFADQIRDANAHAAESERNAAQSAQQAGHAEQEASDHVEKSADNATNAQHFVASTAEHDTKAGAQRDKAADAEHQAQANWQKVEIQHTAAVESAHAAGGSATSAAQKEQAAGTAASGAAQNLDHATHSEQGAEQGMDEAVRHATATESLAGKSAEHAATIEQMHGELQGQVQQLGSLIDQAHAMLSTIHMAEREAFEAVEVARVRRQMRAIQQALQNL